MKLLQTYCNNISIEPPENPTDLPTQFYPLPAVKYITIQNSSGMPAKDYDLWQDVINLIHPFLNVKMVNMKIVQLGSGEIRPLNNAINLLNKTTVSQSIYILKNSLLHAGNDSYMCHAATNIPVVALYGSTSVTAHSPYFYHPKSVFIESHRNGNKPSYQQNESVKTINYIKPETVARAILDILFHPPAPTVLLLNHNTLFVGDLYNQNIIDVIPDQVINPQSLPPGAVNLRGDLFSNPQLIIENLKLRGYILHLSQNIDVNILKQLKQNIQVLLFEVTESTDIGWLKSVIKAGINLQLFTLLTDEELQPIKFDYLDLPLIQRKENVTFDQLKEKIKIYNNWKKWSEEITPKVEINYFSSKIVLGGGKIYPSIYAWKNSLPVENTEQPSRAILGDQDFLNEIVSFRLFS